MSMVSKYVRILVYLKHSLQIWPSEAELINPHLQYSTRIACSIPSIISIFQLKSEDCYSEWEGRLLWMMLIPHKNIPNLLFLC